MLKPDRGCSLAPFFDVEHGKLDAFKALAREFLTKTHGEAGCIEYAFSLSGNIAHCCKGYVDAEALLAQLQNVEQLLAKAGRISKVIRLEVRAPDLELEKLRGPMRELNSRFFSCDRKFSVTFKRSDSSPSRSEPRMTMIDYVPRPAAAASLERRRAGFELLSPLTQQELQVIRQMERGATNRQMSQCLFVTENTIKFHLKNIFCKLYVSNRLQALIAARDLGLVGAA
ncbi:LuxR C-terminal-related transcriptional regulator [Hydrocarboniphaga sp.]|uniref:LuxR C-terminal-related transcriptional regulator n=1 Tax=Hydrocarboniphaga sp. TaxID=2033016 RepID=UPI003D129CA3